ncbi:DUF4878 domain-containing protein [Cardiobacterium hominis]|uniref:DUF4878 domain-containing protein n=1 Tax=Cardiobacterium hominis TaxID=2718 RepID=UPI0028D3722D|nr:DUF4878 domain-containing protein [Cardiobacterium hominis]
MKKLVQTLYLMIFATTLAACGEKASEKTPEEVVKFTMVEFISGNPEKAFEYIDFEHLSSRSGDNIDKLKKQFLDNIRESHKKGTFSEGAEIKIKKTCINYEDNTATVDTTLINKKDNTEETNPVKLVKTDQGWKVRFE